MSKKETFQFQSNFAKPYIIAGPCIAESYDLLEEVATILKKLASELNFELIFKASFDKANRSALDNYRGPGMETALSWFQKLKKEKDLYFLTDVHETTHIKAAAEVCDVLQIPAFLCRQTDLIQAAVNSGRAVNVKKGQFLAPTSTKHIVEKARHTARENNVKAASVALTERGSSFGYGDLLVDMRSFMWMQKSSPDAVIFDITHSTQVPTSSKETAGARSMAPLLARSAAASGYCDGFFLEVHPDPSKAKSDASTQLSIPQATSLLKQVIPLWRECRDMKKIDANFT